MKTGLLVLIFCLCINLTWAQSTANYTFGNGSSASLTDMSSGATNILIPTSTSGDFVSAVHPIGFDFWMMGTRYAFFSVNSNGLMRLGKVAVSSTGSNAISTSANLPLLTAFWDNLNSYTTSSTSRVRYKVTGTVPNRVLTVEWKDFIISNNSTNGVQLSTWQIRLYETTGIYEFVYGRMQVATGSATVTASIGMTHTNVNNGLIYLNSITTPSVLRTTAGAVNNLVNTNTAGNIIALNSTANGSRVNYTFTPVLPNADPVGLNFTTVGTGSMTLNWTCAATNELGFVIYRSDDGGATYQFVTQTAANAISSTQSALSPGTTYHWKVYAVTEGALSNSVDGSEATTSCVGAPVNNTLALTGTGIVVWSTAGWSLGHPPTACENAIINFTRSSSATLNLNLDAAATVNNLTLNGIYSSNGIKIINLNTNGNNLTVLGNLTISSTGGNAVNQANLLAHNGSVVRIHGNATIGLPSDSKFSGIGGATGQDPDFYFKGNMTYNANATNFFPGTYYFDGGLNQTLTNLSTTDQTDFGNVEIGAFAPTKLTITGAEAVNTYIDNGNLTVHGGSTLNLPFDASFNQKTANTGSFNIKANATLILGDYGGGQVGSNFPTDYTSYIVDSNSTVEYNYAGAQTPVIFTDINYGNLILTNASIKYNTAPLVIRGNFTNNINSTYACTQPAYFLGATMINNGTISGSYTDAEFGFYGDVAQDYSGTGDFGTAGSAFGNWGIHIFNPATVTLNAAINTHRVNLFNGDFVNSSNLKIGTTSVAVIQRGGASDYHAGRFDEHPIINSPDNLILRYDNAASIINTGFEIPASAKTNTVYSNSLFGVTLTSNLNITNDFQLLTQTFDIADKLLKIQNTITITGGNINGSAGTLEMTGTTAQNIPASTFVNNNLYNLIISNTNASTGVTLNGTLDVYRSVNYGTTGLKLTTGGFLTLKSTDTETAWLGNMTGKTITGNVTVERRIPLHNKAWQFLSAPTFGQTIKQAWQEGSVTVNGNPLPGYGIQLTGAVANATTQPSPGFDVSTPLGASIKIFNSTTDTYDGVTSTSNLIANPKGYMVFVRGDRSVTTAGASATATTLRTRGTLYTPANAPSTVNVTTTGFESVGNPYASAIDFRSLTITGGVQNNVFYMWDPKLTSGVGTQYGFGGIQTFTWNGSSFDVSPGGGSYAGSNRMIESGQAFFVNAPLTTGSVSFTENAKVQGSNSVNRLSLTGSKVSALRTQLYVQQSSEDILIDGVMQQLGPQWSNHVDMEDAYKFSNSGESIALKNREALLSVEHRKNYLLTDTIQYVLNKLKQRSYVLEFIPENLYLEGFNAFLEDRYLKTYTSISITDTTRYQFNLDAVSVNSASDRFRLIFRKKIENSQEETFVIGRIVNQSDEKDDDTRIRVVPNPVVNHVVNLELNRLEAGQYQVQLLQSDGQPVYQTTMNVSKRQSRTIVQLNENIRSGIYQLVLIAADGKQYVQSIIIK